MFSVNGGFASVKKRELFLAGRRLGGLVLKKGFKLI